MQLSKLNKENTTIKENPIEILIENMFKKLENIKVINSSLFEEFNLTTTLNDYKIKIENEINLIISKYKLEISSKISDSINDLEKGLKTNLETCEDNIERLASQLKAANIPLDVIMKTVDALTDYQKKLNEKLESLHCLKENYLYNINDI